MKADGRGIERTSGPFRGGLQKKSYQSNQFTKSSPFQKCPIKNLDVINGTFETFSEQYEKWKKKHNNRPKPQKPMSPREIRKRGFLIGIPGLIMVLLSVPLFAIFPEASDVAGVILGIGLVAMLIGSVMFNTGGAAPWDD